MAVPADTIDLFVGLSVPARRAQASRELAAKCGVEEILLFIRDAEVGALIPAPGFSQTLVGGASWRALLKRCASPGRYEERVEFPAGTWRQAFCLVPDGIAAIFLGATPVATEIALVERLLPMLAHALHAEQQARFASAAEADARKVADRAHALADALEGARAEHARLNARLREEHRRKDDFLAMLAHELRNPLTPLVTSIELLRRAGAAGSERPVAIMARQVRQLSRLVEDLLDVSRVSRGRIELRRHRLNLVDTVTDAIESSRTLLEGRRHEIVVELPREALHVSGDSVRLAQVFANLLHNAGKYTDPGGRIEITVGCLEGRAFVRIRDNGTGIEPEMLGEVFDLFAQAPVSLARAQGGLGIGLTLVRALVELHGGRVEAYSAGPGHGSTFTVYLPIAAAVAVQPETLPAAPRAAPETGLRVLIVDDNEDAADSLADILRLMGHHAETSYSGVKALQIAADVDPDLVLLDIGLPEMDGLEVAKRLRRILLPRVRLVAVTGYGAEEDRRRTRDAGFDEHAVKPLMPEVLAGIVARVRAPLEGGAAKGLTGHSGNGAEPVARMS